MDVAFCHLNIFNLVFLKLGSFKICELYLPELPSQLCLRNTGLICINVIDTFLYAKPMAFFLLSTVIQLLVSILYFLPSSQKLSIKQQSEKSHLASGRRSRINYSSTHLASIMVPVLTVLSCYTIHCVHNY